jgi:hypothetical protein
MDRRAFLRRALAASAGGAVAVNTPMLAAGAQSAIPGEGPYGPLRAAPDENGLLLPDGFTSRVVGLGGEPVGGTGYLWPAFPDGAATYPTDDGGWIYTVNSEVFDFMVPASGGASAVRFGADGEILDAYRILEGSHSNCAGGPTPWGTWLSCEEAMLTESGLVWECDPTGQRPAVAHEAMGRWAHEAVAVDPVDGMLYQTQDHPAGLLYRFVPDAYPDLSAGRLDACVVGDDGSVSWLPVPDPSGTTGPTREQIPEATRFSRGEGIWYHDGWIYFCTTGDHTVHGIDLRAQTHTVLWRGDPDGLGIEGAVLSHVDNITVDAGTGDLYVAEDGGNMEVVVITAEGVVAPFVRVVGDEHAESEVTGPCFSPDRSRLYFSSQRGPTPKALRDIVPGYDLDARTGGITYEITGPFRGVAAEPDPAPTTTEAPEEPEEPGEQTPDTTVPSPVTTLAQAGTGGGDGGGGGNGAVIGIGVGVVAAAAVAGVVAVRRRGAGPGGAAGPDAGDPGGPAAPVG